MKRDNRPLSNNKTRKMKGGFFRKAQTYYCQKAENNGTGIGCEKGSFMKFTSGSNNNKIRCFNDDGKNDLTNGTIDEPYKSAHNCKRVKSMGEWFGHFKEATQGVTMALAKLNSGGGVPSSEAATEAKNATTAAADATIQGLDAAKKQLEEQYPPEEGESDGQESDGQESDGQESEGTSEGEGESKEESKEESKDQTGGLFFSKKVVLSPEKKKEIEYLSRQLIFCIDEYKEILGKLKFKYESKQSTDEIETLNAQLKEIDREISLLNIELEGNKTDSTSKKLVEEFRKKLKISDEEKRLGKGKTEAENAKKNYLKVFKSASEWNWGSWNWFGGWGRQSTDTEVAKLLIVTTAYTIRVLGPMIIVGVFYLLPLILSVALKTGGKTKRRQYTAKRKTRKLLKKPRSTPHKNLCDKI